MSKIIINSSSNLDSFYEQTLQYLHEKYHSHPTTLNGPPLTEAEAARISYFDGMGRDAVHRAKSFNRYAGRYSDQGNSDYSGISGDLPTGKTVF